MNQLQDELKSYSNYFNGFQEIYAFKSVEEVCIGVLKVISYATLVIPIIAYVGYLITQNRIEELSELRQRVSTNLKDNKAPIQIELATYLASDTEDGKVLESDVFKKLDEEGQRNFFSNLVEQNKLQEALEQTPKDLKEISFSFGDDYIRNFDKGCELVNIWVKKLQEFKSLEKINVDLSSVTYCTRNVVLLLNNANTVYNNHKQCSDLNLGGGKGAVDHYNEGGLIRQTNYSAAETAIHGLIKYWHNHKELKEISICFRGTPINTTVLMKKAEKEDQILVFEKIGEGIIFNNPKPTIT